MTKMRAIGSAHEDEICAGLNDTQRRQLAGLLETIAAGRVSLPVSTRGYQQARADRGVP